VRDERWKWMLVHDRTTKANRETTFDLAADPGEETPLPGGDRPEWTPAFAEAVRRARAARGVR
jgi:hypothetical protein